MLIRMTVLNPLNLELLYLIIYEIFLEINNQKLGDDLVEVKKARKEKTEKANEEEKLEKLEEVKNKNISFYL